MERGLFGRGSFFYGINSIDTNDILVEAGARERVVDCNLVYWFLVFIAGLHPALVWGFNLTETILPGGKVQR